MMVNSNIKDTVGWYASPAALLLLHAIYPIVAIGVEVRSVGTETRPYESWFQDQVYIRV